MKPKSENQNPNIRETIKSLIRSKKESREHLRLRYILRTVHFHPVHFHPVVQFSARPFAFTTTRKTFHNFRRLDGASQNEEFMLTNVHRSKRSARNSMLRKSKELTHPISVIEFCVFLRYFFLYSRYILDSFNMYDPNNIWAK